MPGAGPVFEAAAIIALGLGGEQSRYTPFNRLQVTIGSLGTQSITPGFLKDPP
jgi:hypothetical protein